MPELKSYHFDCGNSNEGPVGFCARVLAETPEEALRFLHEAMPETIEVQPMEHGARIEYIHVYTNTDNIDDDDIDDGDDDENDDEED